MLGGYRGCQGGCPIGSGPTCKLRDSISRFAGRKRRERVVMQRDGWYVGEGRVVPGRVVREDQ